jgi:hypothetical protein
MICLKCISSSYPSTLHHNAFVFVVDAAVDGQLQEITFVIHTTETHSIQIWPSWCLVLM